MVELTYNDRDMVEWTWVGGVDHLAGFPVGMVKPRTTWWHPDKGWGDLSQFHSTGKVHHVDHVDGWDVGTPVFDY